MVETGKSQVGSIVSPLDDTGALDQFGDLNRPPVRLRSCAAARCIIYTIHKEELKMDFIRALQARDWLIAVAGFVAGAIIF